MCSKEIYVISKVCKLLYVSGKKSKAKVFCGLGSLVSILQNQNEEIDYWEPGIPQKFVVLIILTKERWRTAFNMEPAIAFELGTSSISKPEQPMVYLTTFFRFKCQCLYRTNMSSMS